MISKASRKFSVETVDDVPELDFRDGGPFNYKKTTLSVSSMGKIPKELKISFSPSMWMSFHYNSGYPGQVITEQFIEGASTEKFNLLHT
ncbi:hypothetical protein C0J52_23461 [Blattella germanica]|nr:hypothetical protein C0J52_23461 [Blattella germanica]